jgi:MFS family permease
MIVGAVLFPVFSRRVSPRAALIVASFMVAIGYLLFLLLHDEFWQVLVNMVIAGIGSGALVGALPSAAAAAAPRGQSGIATGLTNTTKTLGGALASAVFGVVLHAGLSGDVASGTGLGSYIAVWTICGIGALAAGILLFFVPRLAFSDAEPVPTPVPEPLDG